MFKLRYLRHAFRIRIGWTSFGRPLPTGSASYVPLTEVRGFWRQRAILRELGISRREASFAAHWLDRWLPPRKPVTMIWFFQKNTRLGRRVRAVAISTAQSSALSAQSQTPEYEDSFAWNGHQLLNDRNKPIRGAAPNVVHALVRTHRFVQHPSIETRVRVLETYESRAAAEKALAKRLQSDSDSLLAVITYPVGEMLF